MYVSFSPYILQHRLLSTVIVLIILVTNHRYEISKWIYFNVILFLRRYVPLYNWHYSVTVCLQVSSTCSEEDIEVWKKVLHLEFTEDGATCRTQRIPNFPFEVRNNINTSRLSILLVLQWQYLCLGFLWWIIKQGKFPNSVETGNKYYDIFFQC